MKKIVYVMLMIINTTLSAQTLQYSRVKIYLDQTHTIKRLATLGVEADHGDFAPERYLINEFSSKEIAKIKRDGFVCEILIPDLQQHFLDQNEAIERVAPCINNLAYKHSPPIHFKYGSMGGYPSYQEMLEMLADMRAKYPTLISAVQTIDTFKTYEQRPIHWVKISDNPNSAEASEAKTLYTALHHAREPAGMAQMIYFMWFLLENYDKSAEIRYIVDNTELCFVPCVNPDGYIYNETTNPKGGGFWRKNRRPWGKDTVGVDLNRNYGFGWAADGSGSSPDPDSETYRGTKGFSEPETSALRFLCEKNNFKTALNYHSFGNLLIYPWGFSDEVADSSFIVLGRLLTRYNKYRVGTASETVGYSVNGVSDDWMYGAAKTFSFTPEVSKSFGFWLPKNLILNMCAENLFQNIVTTQFALQTAELTNRSTLFANQNAKVDFDIQRIGLKDGAFTVSLAPITNNTIPTNNKTTFNLSLFEKQRGSLAFEVKPSTKTGEEIRLQLILSNGFYNKIDTIKLFYQNNPPIVNESGNNLGNWKKNVSNWNTTTKHFISAPSSITDSPNGNYGLNETVTLTSKNYISVPKNNRAFLRYWIKWDIEAEKDYATVSIATSKASDDFDLQCTSYTNLGSFDQLYDQPLYDGVSDWVQEEVDISAYAGQDILLRFELVSDNITNRDGIYLDDVQVWAGNILTATQQAATIDFDFAVYPNPSNDFLTIAVDEKNSTENTVFILSDMLGNTVKKQLLQKEKQVDIKHLAAGMYLYQIKKGNDFTTPKKLIIAR